MAVAELANLKKGPLIIESLSFCLSLGHISHGTMTANCDDVMRGFHCSTAVKSTLLLSDSKDILLLRGFVAKLCQLT